MIQKALPLLPEGAQPVNNNLAILRGQGGIIFFNGHCPMLKCSDNDSYDLRLAQGVLCSTQIVKPAQLAKALGVDRSTVSRNKAIYEKGGPVALMVVKTNRSGYKLDRKKLQSAQRLLDLNVNQNKVATALGVSEGTIRYAIKKGSLLKPEAAPEQAAADLKTPSERSVEDSQSQAGIGVKREAERTLASVGKLYEATPNFIANESVFYAGVLLALPVLCQLGLLGVAKNVYESLRKGFYGLQATLLMVAFMALLRIKSPEQLNWMPSALYTSTVTSGPTMAANTSCPRRMWRTGGFACRPPPIYGSTMVAASHCFVSPRRPTTACWRWSMGKSSPICKLWLARGG